MSQLELLKTSKAATKITRSQGIYVIFILIPSDSTTLIIVGISLALLVILILVGVTIIALLVRRRNQKQEKTSSSQNLVTPEVPMTEYKQLPDMESSSGNLKAIPVLDSKSATNNQLFSFEIDVKDLRLEHLLGLYRS